MRLRAIEHICLLFVATSLFALGPFPTPTVSGTIQVGNSSGLKGNAFVRFRLRNYAGFVPRVVGTGIVVQTQFDVRPSDSLGNFSTVIYSNDVIVPNTCGSGSTACTWWTVEYWNDGKISSSGNYCIPQTNPTYDLTSAVPCTTPPVPANPVSPSGTVTSVGFTGDDTVYNAVVTGSPITSFGTFVPTLHTHVANTFLAGPATGADAAPTFRALTNADIPSSILFPMFAPDGTALAPSYSWANEHGLGLYRGASNSLDFAVNGFDVFSVEDGTVGISGARGSLCFSITNNANSDCSVDFQLLDTSSRHFLLFDNVAGDLGALDLSHLIVRSSLGADAAIDFPIATNYIVSGVESSTPITPSATFQKGYFKASKGWCTVDASGTERCAQKTGTAPIVVTGDAISCPTCITSAATSFQVLFANAGYSCAGDQTVCAFTLTWPSSFGDTNYDAVCNPGDPTNTSGSASLNNGGQGNKTATTIDVYMTVNGTPSQTYANWTCFGKHR